jgi:hypothetical protein
MSSNDPEISKILHVLPNKISKSAHPYHFHSKHSKTKFIDMSNMSNVCCKQNRCCKILPRRKHRSSRVHHIKRPCLDFEKMQKVTKINPNDTGASNF